jgi:hypothetical protein
MKSLQEAVQSIFSQPAPEDLVVLQGALEIAGRFFAYLGDLRSKVAARDYSELASRLDISAVGVVALENMVSGEKETFWQRLFLGGVGEALMVGASRQYVRGWQVETEVVHQAAAWYLAEVLWRASREMQPELPPAERWEAIQSLLAPAYDAGVPAPAKALLLGRVFQLVLLTYLAQIVKQG